MSTTLAHVALIVRDYDEAIDWFTTKLRFAVLADERQTQDGKRWVLVAPSGAPAGSASILLARASSPDQEAFIGNQTGGRVFMFLETTDFWSDYRRLREEGVVIVREPAEAEFGLVAVFADLYGNWWDLVQPT